MPGPVPADWLVLIAGLARPLAFSLAAWMIVALGAVSGDGPAPVARGQTIDRQYTLKAVFLYKFATYVEWPEAASRGEDSPFVIGILGPDPFGDDLRKIAAAKTIAGRRIELRNYTRPDEVRDCHILFLPKALADETQQAALKLLAGRNVLLVGESPEFLKRGGVVDFVVEENRIRIHISKPAYERERLTVSAQLLRIATVVK